MRVGFFVGKIQNEKIGGGHTFQMSIIEGLMNVESEHEFYFYYHSQNNLFEDTKNVKFINMKFECTTIVKKKLFYKKKKIIESHLDKLTLRDNIELVYFISPMFQEVETPFIFTVWDLAYRSSGHFPEVIINNEFANRESHYSRIIPRASFNVIGNNEGKRQICKYFNIENERVKTISMPTPNYVYNLNPDDSILRKHNLESKKFLFYPAQFWPHKNHIRLVKAMKKLKEQGSDFKLVFTGSDVGNEKYIKQKVKEYNLENDVLFLGFVTKQEIIALYQNAFALTYASYFGPDNIPPLESMALKCPVIASDIVGFREQLGDCALFFDSKDENDLVKKIKQLNDKKLVDDLVKKGEILAKDCSVENYISKMIEIIDDFAPIRECWSPTEKYIHL